jgi:hypothetical protein
VVDMLVDVVGTDVVVVGWWRPNSRLVNRSATTIAIDVYSRPVRPSRRFVYTARLSYSPSAVAVELPCRGKGSPSGRRCRRRL